MAKKDITRIDELQSFEHDDDTEVEFEPLNNEEESQNSNELDPIEESPDFSELTVPDFAQENEEDSFLAEESPSETDSDDEVSFDDPFNDSSESSTEAIDDGPAPFEPLEEGLLPQKEVNDNEYEEQQNTLEETSSFIEEQADSPDSESLSSAPLQTTATQELVHEIQPALESLSPGPITLSGNPPYSLFLEGVNPDAKERILSVLKSFELINDQNHGDFELALDHHKLYISQISEYSAVFLAREFRNLCAHTKIGHSSKLRPFGEQKETPPPPAISSRPQNFKKTKGHIQLERARPEITITTAETLEGHQISRYLGVVTAQGAGKENGELGQELIESLKAKAMKMYANALIGLRVQFLAEDENHQLLATATAVWADEGSDTDAN